MDLLTVVLLLASLAASWPDASEAKINCKLASRNLPKSADMCCSFPVPHVQAFEPECSNMTTSKLFTFVKKNNSSDYSNACYYECMWNTTGVLTDENTLDMQKFMLLLDKLYDSDAEVLAELKEYSRECALNVFHMIDEWKKSGLVPDTPYFDPNNGLKCSWIPMMTIICMVKKQFVNCPEDKRRKSKSCDIYKSFLLDCMDTSSAEKPNGLRVIEVDKVQ